MDTESTNFFRDAVGKMAPQLKAWMVAARKLLKEVGLKPSQQAVAVIALSISRMDDQGDLEKIRLVLAEAAKIIKDDNGFRKVEDVDPMAAFLLATTLSDLLQEVTRRADKESQEGQIADLVKRMLPYQIKRVQEGDKPIRETGVVRPVSPREAFDHVAAQIEEGYGCRIPDSIAAFLMEELVKASAREVLPAESPPVDNLDNLST